jgi:hypothetical protein
VFIPKEDGTQRPLSIICLEDKIVQQATVSVMNHIYEVDFMGFSYGFRPGRGQHDALDALHVAVMKRKVTSDKGTALLLLPLLRTVRATFTAHSSSLSKAIMTRLIHL